MKYVWFPGCKIPYHQPQYGEASRAVCAALGVELVDLELGCCGYPVRHQSFEASVLSSARNLALAAAEGLPILTPCKCCYGNLRHAIYWMERNETLQKRIRRLLAQEGLHLPTRPVDWPEPVHLLTALDRDVGAPAIAVAVTNPLTDIKIAAHYGCHALRPGNVTRFDNPLQPTLFERLVEAAGATAVYWPMRLECCGNPLFGKDDRMALKLARKKLVDAMTAGAQVLATACTYCQLQFDTHRSLLHELMPLEGAPPSVLYPQLLGLALGLPPATLGLHRNVTDWARILG
ncbi:CoB--CoM heterodisulfide reductase iron-sulfur subunit B family protein [Oceanidesulfovibrio marinus]|uniref:CoB--CoM heterodisulfide reductase n=1 Tax=Oceanidesulfovibrio marinus TaxID=370038 RepID=A0ABX6NJI8_9BACT|nr:CoB--CoM heterodisulfide reductase iron-sulfur subunit B family protein [Oceanidesulfovibrio marinus]QJT10829.1 CoB--CoM heterodisulfide reductase [Oceanidesulfovibrio marinus]